MADMHDSAVRGQAELAVEVVPGLKRRQLAELLAAAAAARDSAGATGSRGRHGHFDRNRQQ
jgi:hypothetical protein